MNRAARAARAALATAYLACAACNACEKKSEKSAGDAGASSTASTIYPRPVASGSLEHLRDAAAAVDDPPRADPGAVRRSTPEEREALAQRDGGATPTTSAAAVPNHCAATITSGTVQDARSHGNAFLARDFREVYTKLYALPASELPPSSNIDAKILVCRTAGASAKDNPVDTHPCDGPAPWRVSTAHDTYRDETALLMPADGEKVLVVQLGPLGDAACASRTPSLEPMVDVSADARLEKLTLIVTERWQGYAWMPKRSPKTAKYDELVCTETTRGERTTFYDEVSHRWVRVEPMAGVNDAITTHVEGRDVVVDGAGCNERVSLDAPK